jgi:predicted O-methyltransferase YrrM
MQIPREQGQLLAQLVRLAGCRSVCEIGVSYGYSTLHWAAVMAETGGHVHAVDISQKKVKAATQHLTEAGLIDRVTIHLGDGLEVCKTLAPAELFDFVFIDAAKEQSIGYFNALAGKLAPRCVIAADNTGNLADKMKPYVQFIRAQHGVLSCDVPIAHGFELTILQR